MGVFTRVFLGVFTLFFGHLSGHYSFIMTVQFLNSLIGTKSTIVPICTFVHFVQILYNNRYKKYNNPLRGCTFVPFTNALVIVPKLKRR